MAGSHGLQCRKAVERLETLLAPVTGLADAAEWQLDTPASTVIIDEYLTGTKFPRQPHLPTTVPCPHAGDQTVVSAICNRQRLILGLERNHDDDRTKNFLLCELMIRVDVGEQNRPHIVSASGRAIGKHAFGSNVEPTPATALDVPCHHYLLTPGDEWPDVEIIDGRPDTKGCEFLRQCTHQVIIDAAMDENPRTRGTGLPRILYPGPDERWYRRVKIGVIKHQLRRFAAQFQRDRNIIAGSSGLNGNADFGRTCK